MKKIICIITTLFIIFELSIQVFAEQQGEYIGLPPPGVFSFLDNMEPKYFIVFKTSGVDFRYIVSDKIPEFYQWDNQGTPMIGIKQERDSYMCSFYRNSYTKAWTNFSSTYCPADALESDRWVVSVVDNPQYTHIQDANYSSILYRMYTYYINDGANIITNDIESVLSKYIKKFEQNTKVQLFFRTKLVADFESNSYIEADTYFADKVPSGHGAMLFNIEKKSSTGDLRITLHSSSNACIQDSAYSVMNDMAGKLKFANDFNSDKLEAAFKVIYDNWLLQDEYELSWFGKYIDYNISNYSLRNEKLIQPENIAIDEYPTEDIARIILLYNNNTLPEPSEELPPEPIPIEGDSEVNPPAPDGNDPFEGNTGLLSAFWGLIKAIFKLIGSIFSVLIKGLTYSYDIRDANIDSSLFNDNMILGIEFLKNLNIPALNISLWTIFEYMFIAVGLFVIVKALQRVLSLINK